MKMNDFLNKDLTKKVGFSCFGNCILNTINRTDFKKTELKMITTPLGARYAMYDSFYYINEFIPQKTLFTKPHSKEHPDKIIFYQWDLAEEISFNSEIPNDEWNFRKEILNEVLLLAKFEIMNFWIKYEDEWYGVALTEKDLILF